MKCCLVVWICSCRSIARSSQPPVTAVLSTFCCLRNSESIGFSMYQVLDSALVYCVRCTLGFRYPKKYAHQNEPLNQGNLHELKLRLKIVRYPGIEVGCFQDTQKANLLYIPLEKKSEILMVAKRSCRSHDPVETHKREKVIKFTSGFLAIKISRN